MDVDGSKPGARHAALRIAAAYRAIGIREERWVIPALTAFDPGLADIYLAALVLRRVRCLLSRLSF
jgi:hypothetical protein